MIEALRFPVGVHEQHRVTVRKTPKLLFSAFRPQLVQGFVNGVLVAEGEV